MTLLHFPHSLLLMRKTQRPSGRKALWAAHNHKIEAPGGQPGASNHLLNEHSTLSITQSSLITREFCVF
jgi:hypothetical protein